MNIDILETNNIYKARVIEIYSKDLYKIELRFSNYFYYYYYDYVWKIKHNIFDLTKTNTIINQYHQELYVKIIEINKILTVEIKIKELSQYVNLF